MDQQLPTNSDEPPIEEIAHEAASRAAPPDSASGADGLDSNGLALSQVLQRLSDPYSVSSGGRWEIPWIEVAPTNLVEVARRFRDHRDLEMRMLHCLLVVDYGEQLQLVYILLSPTKGYKAMLKAHVPASNPTVDSVTSLWDGAEWYEREMHDLFGVIFKGASNSDPLVLYEGFEGHPGLKSFPLHEYEEY